MATCAVLKGDMLMSFGSRRGWGTPVRKRSARGGENRVPRRGSDEASSTARPCFRVRQGAAGTWSSFEAIINGCWSQAMARALQREIGHSPNLGSLASQARQASRRTAIIGRGTSAAFEATCIGHVGRCNSPVNDIMKRARKLRRVLTNPI
jgi:hypothetical protein